MAAEDGLKAQKLLAQGIALGNVGKKQSRPERAKAFNIKAFALSGRLFVLVLKPRAMPWARCFCPFRAYWIWLMTHPHFFLYPSSLIFQSLIVRWVLSKLIPIFTSRLPSV